MLFWKTDGPVNGGASALDFASELAHGHALAPTERFQRFVIDLRSVHR